MSPLQMVYENGLFRPLEPVALPEGTQVEVLILETPALEDYEASLDILDRIASLPLEGEEDTNVSQKYETVLYPPEGTAP